MMPRQPLGRMYLLILLTMLLWGGTAVAAKLVVRDLPPFTAGLLRYGLAGLLLGAIFWRRLPDPRSLARRDWTLLFWLGLLGTTFNHACFFVGLLFAPAAHGALISPTASAISTSVLAARLGGERLTPGFIAGTLLGVAGVALVVQPQRLVTGVGGATLVGDLLFLLGGSSWGLYSNLSRVAMERLPSVATLTFGICIGTALLVPLALFERPWIAVPAARAPAWGALGYLAVAATVLAFLWWNLALRRMGPGRAGVFTNLVPVFGVGLAWLVLGERLSPGQLVGGLLAVTGVVICQGPAGRGALLRLLGAGRPGAAEVARPSPRS